MRQNSPKQSWFALIGTSCYLAAILAAISGKQNTVLNEWGERQNFPLKGHLDIKAGHLYNNNFFDELIRRGTTSPPTPKVFKTAMNLTPVSATTRLADILLVWLLPLAFGGRRGGMCQATATSWSWISLAKMT